jgi:hypothetical protein
MKKFGFVTFLLAMVLIGANIAIADGDNTNPPAQKATIQGTVMDINTGEALVGVSVELENSGTKYYTDFEGNFEISDLDPGTYTIIASYISYKNSLVEGIKIEEGSKQEIDIHLQVSK